MMKVSVVIPAYNEEKYIASCLNSLKGQEEKADEVIVVNNNSSDETVKKAQPFNVRILNEKKQGITYARNKGFDSASCEIIARCDADTILPPNWIKKIKQDFSKYKIDALTGIAVFYDDPLNTNISTKRYMDFMKLILNGNETLIGPNMVITKNIWDKVKDQVCLDNKKVHEDIDLGLHILKVGGKIRRDNSLVVKISARRWLQKPMSGFMEYPVRAVRTLINH